MILDRSEWRPAQEALVVPERRITLTTEPKRGPLPRADSASMKQSIR
jgi:hypothetical protein